MHASGHVESVDATARGGRVTYAGKRFTRFTAFGAVTAYCQASDEHLDICMPAPMGELLYPAPVLWHSPSGIAHLWSSTPDAGGGAPTVAIEDEAAEKHEEEPVLVEESESEDASDDETFEEIPLV